MGNATPRIPDEVLRDYATDTQWKYYKAWCEFGSGLKAAVEMGVSKATINQAVKALHKKAAQNGYAPVYDLTHPVAPGMRSRGTSIRYDGNGEVQQYWNKTAIAGRDPEDPTVITLPDAKTIIKLSTNYDAQGNVTQQWIAEKPEAVAQVEAWRVYAEELAKDIPRATPVPAPQIECEHKITAIPVGDHHLGMLAWRKETGGHYDLTIGETLLNRATDYLLLSSPPTAGALIAFLGDFMHYDSYRPETPTSRNLLDTDTRFPKMVRTAIRSMRYTIDQSLARHGWVHVMIEIGNHDLSSSIWLMECLRNIYENEPRITIDTSPKHFHYFQWGKVLIGTHHGHGSKMQDLPLIMATDVPEMWGKTEYRYIWTGHIHHRSKVVAKDMPGVEVESFRVLPPEDAYAAQKGYRSKRAMHSIVLDKRYGEVSRNTVNPQIIAAEYGE